MMKKEKEEGGWKNHSSGIDVTHKVIFLDKPISWIIQGTKEIHSHTLEGDYNSIQGPFFIRKYAAHK